MIRKPRLMVTGASGFLGWNICRQALPFWDVVGVHSSRRITLEGVTPEKCQLTDYNQVKALFDRLRPDAVIHAAAIPNPNICQEQPAESHKINVVAAVSVAGLCNDLNIPCVFTSSDLVFDGKRPPYNERCDVSPISVYGEQKVEAELQMAQRHDQLMVCRMPLMYGDSPQGAQSFIQPFILAMRQDRTLTLFHDEYRTPASGESAARGLLLAIPLAPDLLHLGGRESISRYDFCKKLAAALGLPDAKLMPVNQGSIASVAPRPLNVSFDSTRAYSLGYDPKTIDEELCALDCVKNGQQT